MPSPTGQPPPADPDAVPIPPDADESAPCSRGTRRVVQSQFAQLDFEHALSGHLAELNGQLASDYRRAVADRDRDIRLLRKQIAALRRSLRQLVAAGDASAVQTEEPEVQAPLTDIPESARSPTLCQGRSVKWHEFDLKPGTPLADGASDGRKFSGGSSHPSSPGCQFKRSGGSTEGDGPGSQWKRSMCWQARLSQACGRSDSADLTEAFEAAWDEADAREDDAYRDSSFPYQARTVFLNPGRQEGTIEPPTVLQAVEKADSGRVRQSSKYTIAPDSAFRTLWELVGGLVLLYDAVMTPWILAWTPSDTFFTVASIGTTAYWLMDMFFSFFKGFYSNNGEVVSNLRVIRLTYLRTWFLPDVAINSVDTVTLMLDLLVQRNMDRNYSRTAPVAMRAGRLLKLNKILRVVVYFRRLREKAGNFFSETLQFIGLGTRLVAALLLVNHFLGCLWYLIAESGTEISDTGYSWLDLPSRTGYGTYRDAGPFYQYCTALHWTLTQMTPGSMSITPQNSVERLFNVGCLFVGLFVGALLVSQLSARMVQMQMQNQEQNNRITKLTAYMRENSIRWGIRTRVHHQLADRLHVNKRLTLKDVPLLDVLSMSLRKELAYATFAHHVMSHSLFCAWGILEPQLMESICLRAVDLMCMSVDDDVFTPNTSAEHVYLVLKGRLRYSKYDKDAPSIHHHSSETRQARLSERSSSFTKPELETVEEHDWVSEAAIWLEWTYSGTLTSLTKCELLSMHVPTILDILGRHTKVCRINFHYCAAFVRLVQDRGMSTVGDLKLNIEQVLMAMPIHTRMDVMDPILRSHCGGSSLMHWSRSSKVLSTMGGMKAEMRSGRAIVSLDKGVMVRTVLVVTLEVQRRAQGGQILIRLAKAVDGHLKAAAALPGTKMRETEDAHEALERILAQDLVHLRAKLRIHRAVTHCESTTSMTFKIPTKYMIAKFSADLESPPEASLPDPAEARVNSHVSWGTSHNRSASSRTRKSRPRLTMISGVLFGASADADILHDSLEECECFLVQRGVGDEELYAWLNAEVFRISKTPRGHEVLQQWIDNHESAYPFPSACATQPQPA